MFPTHQEIKLTYITKKNLNKSHLLTAVMMNEVKKLKKKDKN